MRIVVVRWIDSRGVGTGWERVHECLAEKILPIHSFGAVLHEDDQEIVIAAHVGVETDRGEADWQVCGAMHIPKVAVESVDELGELSA